MGREFLQTKLRITAFIIVALLAVTAACVTATAALSPATAFADESTTVYWSPASGADANDGSTSDTAVQSYARAAELAGGDTIVMLDPFQLTDGSELAIESVTLKPASGYSSQAMFSITNGTLTLKNVRIDASGVNTSYYWTTIYVNDTNATLNIQDGTTIAGHASNTAYPAVCASGGTVNMSGGTISGNAGGWGGAVYLESNATFNMTGGVIENNTATSGGAVYAVSSAINISGGTISNNTASSQGGALYAKTSSTITISGGTISGNYASYGGVCYATSNSTVTMTGGTLSGNEAKNYAGALYISQATLSLEGGVIENNTAKNATVCIGSYSTATFSGATIANNTAAQNAGGVFIYDDATLTMTGGAITGNTANTSGGPYTGGAIYMYYGSKATLSGGEISGNAVEGGGYGAGIAVTRDRSTAPTLTLSGTCAISDDIYLANASRDISVTVAQGFSTETPSCCMPTEQVTTWF